jgi:3-hydroxyisobutyrate dehydrogenase-like beta-hydroxyacid dehydrogenase
MSEHRDASAAPSGAGGLRQVPRSMRSTRPCSVTSRSRGSSWLLHEPWRAALLAACHPGRGQADDDGAAMTRIAVVGLGSMGSRIASRLVIAGHDVVAWNRTAARGEAIVGPKPRRVQSPADAARWAEVVITMVADPQALRDVTEGPAGVLSGARPSTTVIQMSTVGPEAVLRLASVLPPGVGLLDAPVLGSLSEAEAGSLRIFVGGPPELVEQQMAMFFDLGSPMLVGPVGAGTAAKLVANAALFGVVGLLGEVLVLARALGLPADTSFDVIATTPLAAQAERRRPAIQSSEYPARFSLALARKDADLIMEAGRAVGVDLPFGAVVHGLFADAVRAGLGDRDYSAVLAHILGSRDHPAGSGLRSSEKRDERSRPQGER